MKILFDQNISFRLIKKISQLYPNAKQVRQLGLENQFDIKIWKFAKSNNYTVVTFDVDFIDLINLKGHPPKIIWLKTGNITTDSLAKLFDANFELIRDFIRNEDAKEIAFLEISTENF